MLFGKKSGGYAYIIAGLGNPGAKYEMTRHNAGFLALELLARENNFDIKRLKFHALTQDFFRFWRKMPDHETADLYEQFRRGDRRGGTVL